MFEHAQLSMILNDIPDKTLAQSWLRGMSIAIPSRPHTLTRSSIYTWKQVWKLTPVPAFLRIEPDRCPPVRTRSRPYAGSREALSPVEATGRAARIGRAVTLRAAGAGARDWRQRAAGRRALSGLGIQSREYDYACWLVVMLCRLMSCQEIV